ncbi:P-loop nucleoside triphosphate hydrolasessuperfamily protein with CH (Calponin Homology) domain [Striga asiatica]|uniref:P-loop nucleoside triphosphate hydrolasessuperfamily protein with CH (Calponin Homology) domain n=1 Tax=Striga asiatica TaxID=4170 RepID=A0A5A7PJW5_STRAF|nr:P-loop nucleoside triphosphate hydrolasessuperfamily protein with CH (Calponin Homology) domain [Striga asiatica]
MLAVTETNTCSGILGFCSFTACRSNLFFYVTCIVHGCFWMGPDLTLSCFRFWAFTLLCRFGVLCMNIPRHPWTWRSCALKHRLSPSRLSPSHFAVANPITLKALPLIIRLFHHRPISILHKSTVPASPTATSPIIPATNPITQNGPSRFSCLSIGTTTEKCPSSFPKHTSSREPILVSDIFPDTPKKAQNLVWFSTAVKLSNSTLTGFPHVLLSPTVEKLPPPLKFDASYTKKPMTGLIKEYP